MQKAKEETGLNTICEVISAEAIDAAVKYIDMIQIGARNMQNFQLFKGSRQVRSSGTFKERTFRHH